MMRFLLKLLLVLLVLWAMGYAAFAQATTGRTPQGLPPVSSGIVALTGGTGARIAAAVALLEADRAPRLLISGVNPITTKADLVRLAGADPAMFDCCVDLGYEAETTLGNAREIAAWAKNNRMASVIVVTSDYHMPRAILELRSATGDSLTLHRWPVGRAHGNPWWRDQKLAQRILVEYAKWQVVWVRDLISDGETTLPTVSR